MRDCYAAYRLPDEGTLVHLVESDRAVVLRSPRETDGRTGFVIAPFEVSEATPYLYIEGTAREFTLPEDAFAPIGGLSVDRMTVQTGDSADGFERYKQQFDLFHQAIMQGCFSKVVLARRSDERNVGGVPPREMFRRACQLFPHCFVALFHTPQTGTWLTATPEILLEQSNGHAHTIALAGTMTVADNQETGQAWSEKNRTEQRYVSDYIRSTIKAFAQEIEETPARTFVAGNVMHLRSDFVFTMPSAASFGALVEALHPTPAVCGTPTEAARRFILAHESQPRSYYSGYCGPTSPSVSHLYVMLRCMHIDGNESHLYAGGGLVAESTARDEWEETEAKLYAMRVTLAHSLS